MLSRNIYNIRNFINTMEIQEILEPKQIERFENFCKEVQCRATLHISHYHKEVVNAIENKMQDFPMTEKRKAYKDAMAKIHSITNNKSKAAMTIFFETEILNEND